MCGFALDWVCQEVREVKFFGYLNRFFFLILIVFIEEVEEQSGLML